MKLIDEIMERETLKFIDEHPRSELAFAYRLGRKKAMVEMAESAERLSRKLITPCPPPLRERNYPLSLRIQRCCNA